jgi:hypothetical protein
LTYENPDYDVSILYPTNNWTKYEIDLQPYQVVYFTTNETIGGMFDTRPIAFISIYVEPTTDTNLNQSTHSFFENTKDENSYRILSSTMINLTSQNLQAYRVAFYDYSNEKSNKMLKVWLVKDGYRYLLVYGPEPGRFDTFLPFAQQMIDSFEVTNNTFAQHQLQMNQSMQTDGFALSDGLYNQCLETTGKDICDTMFSRK